jgi:hypothetical protein
MPAKALFLQISGRIVSEKVEPGLPDRNDFLVREESREFSETLVIHSFNVVRMNPRRGKNRRGLLRQGRRLSADRDVGTDVHDQCNTGKPRSLDHLLPVLRKLREIQMRVRVNEHVPAQLTAAPSATSESG